MDRDHGARFQARSVAENYAYRPPYDREVFALLIDLLPASCRRVLDVGCGTGKIARELCPEVELVDAVDPSAAMIEVGQALAGAEHRNLNWIHAPIETANLNPPYGLVVAGASLHWMELDRVFRLLREVLDPAGLLVAVDGDGPCDPPWGASRQELIVEYSTMRDYQPFDPVETIGRSGCFEVQGCRVLGPYEHAQTPSDFLRAEHYRASLTEEGLGPTRRAEFDGRVAAVLEPHLRDGLLHYQVATKLVWAKPISFSRTAG